MMTIIRKEPDKLQKNVYFNMVLDRLFAGGWGWYMRLGQSLSATRPITMASQLQESKRANGLQVLRRVKDMHIELRHKPNYIPMTNQFIREFGGTILTRVQKQQQKNAKFNRAAAALAAGEKVPRKMKKQIKSALEKTR